MRDSYIFCTCLSSTKGGIRNPEKTNNRIESNDTEPVAISICLL